MMQRGKPLTLARSILQRTQSRMIQKRMASSAVSTHTETAGLAEMEHEAIATPQYRFPDYLTRVAPTQVTTLDNGFRIVTEPRQGETAAVGVYIGAGSRHENRMNNGVAHFLEHMYFKGTKRRTARDLEVEFENAGAHMNAHTSREYTAYTSHCLSGDVDRSVDALADVLLNSEISVKDIEAERGTILREMEDVNQNIDEVLFDQLHLTAYQGSSLGYTILGPEENIRRISRSQMLEYRNTFYTAPRMVLVGTGNVSHEKLVELGERYFSELPTQSKTNKPDTTPDAFYVGSDIHVLNPDIPLLHLTIAFEGPGLASGDNIALNLIQLMLGSYDKSMGASKYVTTPFLADMIDADLARYLAPFHHAYSDTSLFGIHSISSGVEDGTDSLMCGIVRHMSRFAYKVNSDELERAKNLLKNQVLMSYEGGLSRSVEEIGRNMLYFGRRPSIAEMFARIDAVTVDDIKATADKYIFDKDPVVAAIGNTEHAVDYTWLKLHTYQWRI